MISRKMFISKGLRVKHAVRTLFDGFRTCDRDETAWARRLMTDVNPTDSEVEAEILTAIQLYCPNVPDDFVPFVVELLRASIRLARQDAGLDISRPHRSEAFLEVSLAVGYGDGSANWL
jgi:hypothetical protein